MLGQLIFVGLGLSSERSISLQGLDLAKEADCIFAEFYTSPMPHLDFGKLERLVGKPIQILRRSDVEEYAQHAVLERIRDRKAVFLVPGDPMVATTHIDLRLRAEKAGVKTRVIAGASILSAIGGLTGLQAYKFGRTVTIPYVEGKLPESPYDHIKTNLQADLHTLALLDVAAERDYYMSIREGLEYVQQIELRRSDPVIGGRGLLVGIARAGADDAVVKAGTMGELVSFNFGGPPHCLIIPANLHFMEAEALEILAGADPRTVKRFVSR